MNIKSTIKNIAITILFLILVISSRYIAKYTNRIELTQLTNNSLSQMMGYVIKTRNDKVIVIDGGTKEDYINLQEHIVSMGNKVDYWILTHPHKDHAGAFIEIINNTDIEVLNVFVSLNEMEWYSEYEESRANEAENVYNALGNEKLKDKVIQVVMNQKLKLDNINCEILGVANPEITTNAINNSSMVIKMYVNDKSILFLGDTGVESGNKLLELQKDKLKSDIVQMAHHGQKGADENLYNEIKPTICLWPTPDWLWNNDLGEGENTGPFKTFDTRGWIEKLEVEKNIIEKDGNITIEVW